MDFVIAGEHTRIEISVHGYEQPDERTGDDANWLQCTVRARVGVFLAKYDLALITRELADFYEELVEMHERNRDSAALVSMEPGINCVVNRNPLNGVDTVTCTLESLGPVRAKLECGFLSDQSYFKSTVSELAQIVGRYPIK